MKNKTIVSVVLLLGFTATLSYGQVVSDQSDPPSVPSEIVPTPSVPKETSGQIAARVITASDFRTDVGRLNMEIVTSSVYGQGLANELDSFDPTILDISETPAGKQVMNMYRTSVAIDNFNKVKRPVMSIVFLLVFNLALSIFWATNKKHFIDDGDWHGDTVRLWIGLFWTAFIIVNVILVLLVVF